MPPSFPDGAARPAAPALREIAGLPGPRGLPLLGNLLQLDRARPHQAVEAWAREFGPLFRLRIAGRRFVAVADHALVAAVLRDRPAGFRRTTRLEEIWNEMGFERGVFGANGDDWRRQRPMVMAAFDPAHVRAYFPALHRVALRLEARWRRAARAGAAVDLRADLMRYTVDAITGLAFGTETNTLEGGEDVIQRHLDLIFPALARRMFAPLPLWRLVRLPSDRRLERGAAEVRAAIDGFVAAARARLDADPGRRAAPRNLLEAMVAAADAGGLDDRDVAGNALTMLLAGEDTTANTLAWALHLLARHPQALARAVDEVRRVAPDPAALTLERLGALDWLQACLDETMRLKPVAPLQVVQAVRDGVVGDLRVPAGTLLWCLLRHDSLDERHFPRAAAFEPARWLEGAAAAGGGHAGARRVSMPFGAGPRICPGRYLALLEMKTALAVLLASCDVVAVEAPGGGEAAEVLSFTMAPAALRMTLRERAA